MSETLPDARDLRRAGDINSIKQYFNEPSRLAWHEPELKELSDLYQIASQQDDADPVGWVMEFDRSHPRKLDVGRPTQRRLGKILYMAQLYLDKQANNAKRVERKERNF